MTLNDTSRLVVLGTAVLFIASQAPECTREMRARREMVAAIKEIGGSPSTRQSLLADVMRACPHENCPHRPGREKCAVGCCLSLVRRDTPSGGPARTRIRGTAGKAIRFVRDFYPTWDHKYRDELMAAFDLDAGDAIATMSFGAKTKLNLLIALASSRTGGCCSKAERMKWWSVFDRWTLRRRQASS